MTVDFDTEWEAEDGDEDDAPQVAKRSYIGSDGLVHVMHEKCSTCIFGPNTPLTRDGRFLELREAWTQRNAEMAQVCHQTSYWDDLDPEDGPEPDDVIAICRGWYDEFFIERGLPVAAIQIAERLGVLDLDFHPTPKPEDDE